LIDYATSSATKSNVTTARAIAALIPKSSILAAIRGGSAVAMSHLSQRS
jgi:hypothetical protein